MINYFKVLIKNISQIKNQKYNSQTGTYSAILSLIYHRLLRRNSATMARRGRMNAKSWNKEVHYKKYGIFLKGQRIHHK